MFEPEVFRKQMYCIEESICVIVGTFRRPPQWFVAPIVIRRSGICAPLVPPRYVSAPVGENFDPTETAAEENQMNVVDKTSTSSEPAEHYHRMFVLLPSERFQTTAGTSHDITIDDAQNNGS